MDLLFFLVWENKKILTFISIFVIKYIKCECSSMVELQPSKLIATVRFRSLAVFFCPAAKTNQQDPRQFPDDFSC
jgi:hypothetical protein